MVFSYFLCCQVFCALQSILMQLRSGSKLSDPIVFHAEGESMISLVLIDPSINLKQIILLSSVWELHLYSSWDLETLIENFRKNWFAFLGSRFEFQNKQSRVFWPLAKVSGCVSRRNWAVLHCAPKTLFNNKMKFSPHFRADDLEETCFQMPQLRSSQCAHFTHLLLRSKYGSG